MPDFKIRLLRAFCLFLATLWLASIPARAADVVVTTTDDEADGECLLDCSLRDAVGTAMSGDTVKIFADTFVLSLGDILIVDKDITIDGADTRETILDGGGASRIFNASSSDFPNSVVIQDVTLINTPEASLGAVLGVNVNLTLARCTLRDNDTTAVWAVKGSLTIDRCTISNNVYLASPPQGAVLLTTSALQLTNSTISNNQENLYGILAATSTLDILNSTIAENQGVNLVLFESPATLGNTILLSAPGQIDCLLGGGATVSGSGNLHTDATCGLGSGNLSGDPLLDSLADNGGPTDTRTLLDGSPAIDAGDDLQCPAIDQTGTGRPQGLGCDIGAVEVPNAAPDCSGAAATPGILSALLPLGSFVPVQVTGVTDPDGDPVTITVTGIRQDEPISELILGLLTSPDGTGVTTSSPQVRAERRLLGNGRVYHIFFDASDGKGESCTGDVTVRVPPLFGPAVDGGPAFDSTVP